ncbi:MAG: hypothetical protein KAT29_14660, partial [Anaerolineales bacterium]|nr:hypothetical protein [Anaerolineales bacterium]
EFARQIVKYLRRLLLFQMGDSDPGGETPEIEALMQEQLKQITTSDLIRLIRIFNQVATDTRSKWHPGLPLEIAFLEGCETIGAANPAPETSAPIPTPTPKKNPPFGETPRATVKEKEPVQNSAPTNDDRLASKINQNWPQVLTMVRREQPNLYGLLNSCQSRHSTGSVLILGFSSDILKNQMAKRENIEIVQLVVSEMVGTQIEVRSTITTAKNTDIPSEVDRDGMVASALRDMGGEIVDIQ